MSLSYYCLISIVTIIVTLEFPLYSVGESDIFVEVCALLFPAASQITVVCINTTEFTATGKYCCPKCSLYKCMGGRNVRCADVQVYKIMYDIVYCMDSFTA